MQKFSLETKVFLKNREYHLLTSNNVFERKIISSLFEGGELISSQEVAYDHNADEEDVFKTAKTVHEREKLELESLCRISKKLSDGDHAEAHNKLGLAFLARRMYKEAIDEFMRAIDLDSEFGEAHCNLGKACAELGMYEEAEEVYSRAVSLAPEYADFQNNLGKVFLREKKCKRAIRSFEKAIETNPYYGEAHYNLGLAYMLNALEKEEYEYATDLYERTMKEFDTAVRINPDYENERFHSGRQKLADGSIEEALKEFEEALDSVPGRQGLDLPLSFYLRFLYDEENLDEESILDYVKALEEMLEKNPDYADLRNCLGVAYTILCRYINRKTVKQFKHALRINPDYGAALRNLKLAENDSKGFHLLLNTILRGREG